MLMPSGFADSHLDANFAATHREITSDTYGWSDFVDSTLNSYTFAPRYIQDADLSGHRNNLLMGVDLGLEKYDRQDFFNLARTIPEDTGALDRARAGLYAQDEFWLSQQVALTLGARGELCRYSSDVVTNIGAGASSSSSTIDRNSALDAALLYRPSDCVKLYARASTLFRDPFVDEMSTLNPSFLPTNGVPMNTNLKPEIGEQLEVGTTVTIDKQWTVDLSAYRLDMQDEISWMSVDPQGHGFNSNLDQTRRYGTDATLTWQRQEIGLASLTYNYVDATFSQGINEGRNIPLVPANVLTLHGELELPFDLAALATAHAASGQYSGGDNGNQGAKIPDYGTLDLGLRYHPSQLQGFDLLIGVDNVFDHVYANTGYYGFGWGDSYYPAPGRTVKVTASYRF